MRTQCASNFHQGGIGISFYVNDHNGCVPYHPHYEARAVSGGGFPWGYGLLQEYFPSAALGVISRWNDGSARVPFHCPQPAQDVLGDGNMLSISYLGQYWYGTCREAELPATTAIGTGWMTNPWRNYVWVLNHREAGGNILYVDGHVKWRSSGEMFRRCEALGWRPGIPFVHAAFNDN